MRASTRVEVSHAGARVDGAAREERDGVVGGRS